jgi:hypothetical protein
MNPRCGNEKSDLSVAFISNDGNDLLLEVMRLEHFLVLLGLVHA